MSIFSRRPEQQNGQTAILPHVINGAFISFALLAYARYQYGPFNPSGNFADTMALGIAIPSVFVFMTTVSFVGSLVVGGAIDDCRNYWCPRAHR